MEIIQLARKTTELYNYGPLCGYLNGVPLFLNQRVRSKAVPHFSVNRHELLFMRTPSVNRAAIFVQLFGFEAAVAPSSLGKINIPFSFLGIFTVWALIFIFPAKETCASKYLSCVWTCTIQEQHSNIIGATTLISQDVFTILV